MEISFPPVKLKRNRSLRSLLAFIHLHPFGDILCLPCFGKGNDELGTYCSITFYAYGTAQRLHYLLDKRKTQPPSIWVQFLGFPGPEGSAKYLGNIVRSYSDARIFSW